jgi:hypothetical protein
VAIGRQMAPAKVLGVWLSPAVIRAIGNASRVLNRKLADRFSLGMT